MAELTSGSSSFRSTAAAAVAFGIAFGYVEAAVVAYLRAGIEIGAVAPAHDPATLGTFESVETVRELATLVMIGSVGWLAGRSRLERLAWTAVVFGAWDIFYYVGLRLVTGWPPELGTWDVLFPLPAPWVGPVWAPVLVSVALIAFGLIVARRLRAGRTLVLGPVRALAGFTGGGLVIVSFLVDASRGMAGESFAWTGWPTYWAGMALATSAAASALGGPVGAPALPIVGLHHGSESRPSAGSPD